MAAEILEFTAEQWEQVESVNLVLAKDGTVYRRVAYKFGNVERFECQKPSKMQYNLLAWFVQNPGEILNHDQYFIAANPMDECGDPRQIDSQYWEVTPVTIQAGIKRLRKIADIKVDGEWQLFQSMRGRGYVFQPYGNQNGHEHEVVLTDSERELVDLFRDLADIRDRKALIDMVKAFTAMKQLRSEDLQTLFNFVEDL